MDSRLEDFAKVIVNTSTRVQKDDTVLIQIVDDGQNLAIEIYKEVIRVGGHPLILVTPSEATRAFYEIAEDEVLMTMPRHQYELVKASDVIISIKSSSNTKSLSNVDPKKITLALFSC